MPSTETATESAIDRVTHVAVDLTCIDLDTAMHALLGVGFRIDRISPADDPREVDVTGYGASLRVRQVDSSELLPARLYLGLRESSPPEVESWPDNWTIIWQGADREPDVPDLIPDLVISRSTESRLGVGRAGMLYRDLIPGRHGGRYIASHIHIPEGGPVPDYVHYHRIRFQLIFCVRGWVKLVYEDQGEPFVMQAGDAVLQPPEIRHRVLEASDHLEVVEIGCPAEHDTFAEHGFDLPTSVVAPNRDFGGQRFVWHRADGASWESWDHPGFEARNSGIDAATGGVADVRVARPGAGAASPRNLSSGSATDLRTHDHDFRFHFVLEGATTLHFGDAEAIELVRGDSVSVPAGRAYRFEPTGGLELLDVSVSASVAGSD